MQCKIWCIFEPKTVNVQQNFIRNEPSTEMNHFIIFIQQSLSNSCDTFTNFQCIQFIAVWIELNLITENFLRKIKELSKMKSTKQEFYRHKMVRVKLNHTYRNNELCINSAWFCELITATSGSCLFNSVRWLPASFMIELMNLIRLFGASDTALLPFAVFFLRFSSVSTMKNESYHTI